MGNTIRKVYFNATRPIRNFNIERRAHKFISKEKPTPAPQYESTLKQIEVSKQYDPDFMDKQKLKDKQLDKYLKDIYVTSKDPIKKLDSSNKADPLKSLPKNRKTFEFEDMNYYYATNVKEGKCSLQQLQIFLADHANDKKKYTAAYIADQYLLDKKIVENVLKHYNFFKINLKKEKDSKRQFDPFFTISDETDNKDEKKKLS